MRIRHSFLLMILAGMILACAGGGSGTGAKGPVSFLKKVGKATVGDVRRKTELIFSKFQYEVVRQEESYDSFYFETSWKYRSPFKDEADLNVVSARTRFIIRTRPTIRAANEGYTDIHSVEVLGENQVKYAGSEEWLNMPMTPELKAYYQNFAKELEMEFTSTPEY